MCGGCAAQRVVWDEHLLQFAQQPAVDLVDIRRRLRRGLLAVTARNCSAHSRRAWKQARSRLAEAAQPAAGRLAEEAARDRAPAGTRTGCRTRSYWRASGTSSSASATIAPPEDCLKPISAGGRTCWEATSLPNSISAHDGTFAWLVAVCAGAAALFGVVVLTRPMHNGFLKYWLRSLAAVVLFLPAPVRNSIPISPGVPVLVFEAALQRDGQPALAASLLFSGVVAATVLSGAFSYWLHRRRARGGAPEGKSGAMPGCFRTKATGHANGSSEIHRAQPGGSARAAAGRGFEPEQPLVGCLSVLYSTRFAWLGAYIRFARTGAGPDALLHRNYQEKLHDFRQYRHLYLHG